MTVLLRAGETAAISLASAARAAAAAPAPAASAAAAARKCLNSALTFPLVDPNTFVRSLRASATPLSRGPLLRGLQQTSEVGTNSSSSNDSSNKSGSRWFLPSLPLVLQRQQFLEGGSSSLIKEPLLWGPLPYDVPRLPVEEPSCGGRLPSSIPTQAPLEPPSPSSGWPSPASGPPLRAPLEVPLEAPLEAPLGAPPAKDDGERPPEYRCNKVRNDKRHRKRAFVQRGFWGRQRRLQLKHERLRLAFAYQGVDLLKLKSLRWGEVSKGPWGSAIGG
ncbi:hypothetical protein Emed_007340 [Eimeria media]